MGKTKKAPKKVNANTKKKSMSIGVKVYGMLVILIASFMFYNVVSNIGMNQAFGKAFPVPNAATLAFAAA